MAHQQKVTDEKPVRQNAAETNVSRETDRDPQEQNAVSPPREREVEGLRGDEFLEPQDG